MFKVLYAAIRTFLYIEYMLLFSEMWQKVDTPFRFWSNLGTPPSSRV